MYRYCTTESVESLITIPIVSLSSAAVVTMQFGSSADPQGGFFFIQKNAQEEYLL
jgi:hypothetical protein